MRGRLNIKKENYDMIKNFVLNQVLMPESKLLALLSLVSKKGYILNDNRTLFIALNEYELVGIDILDINKSDSFVDIRTVWAVKKGNLFNICMN